MKIPILLLFTFISVAAEHGAFAQQIENMDFAKGKANWLGDGKVVFLDEQGVVSNVEKPGTTRVIAIDLSKTAWRGLRQKIRSKTEDSKIEVALQVKADKAFKRAAESREYSDVDFREGGDYWSSGEKYPKCDFLIRVKDQKKDQEWKYRPISLAPIDSWMAINQIFEGLKGRQLEVELLFPPGDGTVYLKGK